MASSRVRANIAAAYVDGSISREQAGAAMVALGREWDELTPKNKKCATISLYPKRYRLASRPDRQSNNYQSRFFSCNR
jgi:hypothetical protein